MNLKKYKISLYFIVSLLFFGMNAFSQKTWDRGAGTDNWSDANNWNPNGVPTINDDVLLNNNSTPASNAIIVNIDTAKCKSLQIGGTAPNKRAALTFSSSGSSKLTVAGSVTIGGNGSNSINRSGTITFTSGAVLDAGSVILTQSTNAGDSTLNNPGTIDMTNGGRLITGSLAVGVGITTWKYGTGTVVMKATNTLPSVVFTIFNNFIDSVGTTSTVVNDTVVGNLEIKTAGNLSLGAPIYVAGDWTRYSGGSFTQNDHVVYFNGAKNSTITASNGQAFSYLQLSKNRSNYLYLNDSVSISQIFAIDSGILDPKNKNITLLSNATGTASFGSMGSTSIAGINYSGTGRFVVERYIPTGTSAGRHPKAWQFLAVPTNGDGQTIKDAWQEGGSNNSNPKPGYGTQITGYNGTSAGFDLYSRVGSIKTYRATDNSWLEVSNTNATSIYNNKGYMIFVRGSRAVTAYNQSSDSTILRTKGKLLTPANPPSTVTIGANKFESIGNPYACPISFTNIYDLCSASITNGFYTWDPSPNVGTFGLGRYQFHSYLYNYDGCAIQSGQAFFVYSVGSSGTLSFSEGCKVPGSGLTGTMGNGGGNFNYFKYIPVDTSKQFLNISLFSKTANCSNLADVTNLAFSPSFSNGFDVNDALKMMNPGENLSILSGGRNLIFECRNTMTLQDTLQLSLSNLRQQNYRLKFAARNMVNNKLDAYLLDTFTNTEYPINFTDTTSVVFSVTSNPASTGNRFKIFFKPKGTLMVLKASQPSVLSQFKNKESKEVLSEASISVYPNPIIKAKTSIYFKSAKKGGYEILLYDNAAQAVYREKIYLNNNSYVKQLNLIAIPRGMYLLKIIGPDYSVFSEKLLFQ